MATHARPTQKLYVSMLICDELMPYEPSVWRWIRRVLFFWWPRSTQLSDYAMSDTQTILAVKKAVLQDPRICAGHLTPSSLRVSTFREDARECDPKRIRWSSTSKGSHAAIVECNDDETVGECRNERGQVCFEVGTQPSGITGLYEQYLYFCSRVPWFQNVAWVLLMLLILLQ